MAFYFSYYNQLTRREQRIYRESERIASIPLPDAAVPAARVPGLAEALRGADRRRAQAQMQGLLDDLARRLTVPSVRVELLDARPSHDWGELQGLYTPAEGHRPARITLWMRTAKQRRVVAFRTFLRTALHELCHHLDYELLQLEDSFHTRGFYKRESSLFHQLMRSGAAAVPAQRPPG